MSASNPSAPEITEIAGRFQVVQKLGAGAFGTVYKARDKVLGRMLAIKTIRLEGLAASKAGLGEMLDRFKREAQVAAQLKHPNIVTIYDIGEHEGLSYLSMEFIDGVGLDHIISETGRLPIERAAALAFQVADALDYAHHRGVVHRDIKPANIMIEPGDRVKVTDFGIAKVTDSAEHLTVTGSLLGTPSYMSPEQARGAALDGRSDLFSLGCVLYEMVAGKKAFRGESITALLFKIITEEPTPIRETEPAAPDALVRIIEKSLAKAAEARYQTGREFCDDLLALVQPGSMPTLRASDAPTLPLGSAETQLMAPTGQPTLSAAPTLARGAATASTRPASPVPQAATGAIQPTVARPPAASRGGGTRTPPRTVPAKTAGGGKLLLALGIASVLALGAIGAGAWVFLKRRSPETTMAAGAQPATGPAPTLAAAATPPGEPSPAALSSPSAATSPTAESLAVPTAAHAPAETRATTQATTPSATGASAPTPPPAVPSASAGEPAAPISDDSARTAAPASGDYAFLDEVPAEGPDGRAAGDALAQKYRSGGSTGLGNARLTPRSRFPRGLAPVERPAAATLAYLLFSEERYQKANGRFGTLHDLRAAGLRLDVPFARGSFQRKWYRFELTADAAEFKVTATPVGGRGRPLVVDDSGFIRFDE